MVLPFEVVKHECCRRKLEELSRKFDNWPIAPVAEAVPEVAVKALSACEDLSAELCKLDVGVLLAGSPTLEQERRFVAERSLAEVVSGLYGVINKAAQSHSNSTRSGRDCIGTPRLPASTS